MTAPNTEREELTRRLTTLRNERSSWTQQWKDIFDHFRPRAYRHLKSDANNGERKDKQIFNSAPVLAGRTLVNGLMASMTSKARPWFRLGVHEQLVIEDHAAKVWLADVEETLREALSRSNVYDKLLDVYYDIALAGTAALHIEADDETVFRAYTFPVGQYCLALNAKLIVDTIYREYSMTAAQMVEQFGTDEMSITALQAYREKRYDTRFDVVMCIAPNREYVQGRLGWQGKKFVSHWFEASTENSKGFLRKSGFDEFPVMAPRWSTTGEDIYGASPAMDALGDCKSLQHREKRKAQLVDKIVNPPMVGPSGLKKINLLPGETTFIDGLQGQTEFRPAYIVNPQAMPTMMEEIRNIEERINGIMFANLWLSITQQDSQMTAREVGERREEKYLQLGTLLERVTTELLSPMMTRCFALCLRAGKIPPAPPQLQGLELKIEYTSAMAAAQKILGTTAIERMTAFVGNLSTIQPSVLDKIDLDDAADRYGEALGVPPSMIRTDDDVAKLRADRSEQQQQIQAMQSVQEGAVAAKTLSDTDTGGTNALTSMLQGLGVK